MSLFHIAIRWSLDTKYFVGGKWIIKSDLNTNKRILFLVFSEAFLPWIFTFNENLNMVFVYNCPAKKVFLRLKKLQQRWKFFISCIMVFLIRKSTWLISGSSQNAYRMSSSKSREKSFEQFFPLDSAHICFVLFVMIYDLTKQTEYNLHEFVKQNVYIVLRWNFLPIQKQSDLIKH